MTASDLVAALGPVRDGLLGRARAEAGRLGTAAEAQGARAEAQARAEAARILADAAAQGAADAAALRAAELVRTRRHGRTMVLAARQAAYRELSRAVETELARRCGEPLMRAAIAARIRAELGAAAKVVPVPGGGAVGRLDGKRIDVTVATMTAHAVEALGAAVEALWTP